MPIATSSPVTTPRRFTIGFSEILNFAYDAFSSNKLQFILTSLAMAVGTASVILVVTIGLTGKQYILRQIQSIGANMMFMIPIPLTSSVTSATNIKTRVSASAIRPATESNWVRF